jgi:hypothetical protein
MRMKSGGKNTFRQHPISTTLHKRALDAGRIDPAGSSDAQEHRILALSLLLASRCGHNRAVKIVRNHDRGNGYARG